MNYHRITRLVFNFTWLCWFDFVSESFSIPRGSKELPSNIPRIDDVVAALAVVRKASKITDALQPVTNENDKYATASVGTVQKADFSPVTVADFAVQGRILHELHERFPEDGFIAEEDSKSLILDKVLLQGVADAAELSGDMIVDAIELGKSYEHWNKRPSRVWCLDPIDGTRGFLRGKSVGGQYAIALALVEDGIPVVGILGCPNLPTVLHDDSRACSDADTDNTETRGCIFVASRGGGCFQLPLIASDNDASSPLPLNVTTDSTRSIADARFCIGVERYSDALGQCKEMAKVIYGAERALNADDDIAQARRMDSQAKHGVLARGEAELYVRLPKEGYVEWIWDHAAGNVVIEEAGGMMTDVLGREIDFSLGAHLSQDVKGVLMSSGGNFHKALVSAYETIATTGEVAKCLND